MKTLRAMWKRHLREECELLRAALDAEEWKLQPAAERLGCAVSTLQGVLARHPKVEAERKQHMRARGGRGVPAARLFEGGVPASLVPVNSPLVVADRRGPVP